MTFLSPFGLLASCILDPALSYSRRLHSNLALLETLSRQECRRQIEPVIQKLPKERNCGHDLQPSQRFSILLKSLAPHKPWQWAAAVRENPVAPHILLFR